MNEAEKKAVEELENEIAVARKLPYLQVPRELAKRIVLGCGYGKVKEYQDEIECLKLQLEVSEQDKANLERTIEEINETLSANSISIDCDGNVNNDRKLLELAAHVGDTIYFPWIYDGNSGVARLLITEIRIYRGDIYYCADFKTNDVGYAKEYDDGIFFHSTFGKNWFTDKAQAEARLKELKGESV